MDSIEKIDNICKSIIKLTDKDLQAADKMVKEQSVYFDPIDIANQTLLNKTGKKNQKIIAALKNLRQAIIVAKQL